jgi:hypothetical protein
VPRIERRLQLWRFRQTFEANAVDLEANLFVVEDVLKGLLTSKYFKKVLAYTLAIGNHLNGGTKRGRAHGVKLSTLNKLKGIKAYEGVASPGTSLLHFLVMHLESKDKNVKKFVRDLADVRAAARLETSFMSGEIAKMKKQVSILEGELNKHKHDEIDPSTDKFAPFMSEFAASCGERVADMLGRIKQIDSDVEMAAVMYGENAKMKSEELIGMVATFITDWENAERVIEMERQKTMRKQKTAAFAAQRRASVQGGKAGVDGVVASMKSADSSDIRKRRAARQSRIGL